MNQRTLLALLAVAAVVAGLWWAWGGTSPSPSGEQDAVAPPGLDREAIIRRKLAARQTGQIDLSPAGARGRVTVAEGGQGVAGAVVLLTPKGLDQRSLALTPGEAAVPLRARTGADGSWSVVGLPPGRYSLSAAARGFLPGTRTHVTLVAGRDNPGLDIALARGGHPVEGTVSDIGGGPVEGVLVRLTRTDQDSPFNFDRPALGASTDDEGRFEIQLPDGSFSLTTYHPDYVDVTQTLRIDGGPRSVALTVTPASSIEGRVLSRETGEPIAGAIVSRSDDDSGSFVTLGLGRAQVTTDVDGRFHLRGLGSGVAQLSAVARGYATRQPVAVVLGVAEPVADVDILVDRALDISGFVVAAGDEERGLEGVLVGAYSLQPGRLYVATGPSASDGFFEIFGVMPGRYTVGAFGEDALPNLLGTSAEVREHDVDDVLVVMDAGVRVRGRVSPAGPARVSLRVATEGLSMTTMMPSLSNALVQSRADADGVFELHPVAAGGITVVAETDDGRRGEAEVTVRSADIDDLVITLEPRASVAGRVVDASGDPRAGLVVALRSTTPPGRTAFSLSVRGGGPGGFEATTDENGEFAVRGLDAGDYDVTVRPAAGPALEWAEPDDPDHPRAPRRISVVDKEQRRGLTLAVERRDGAITGVVVGADGQPLADAWVTAARDESVREWTQDFAPGPPAATAAPGELDDEHAARLRQLGMSMFAEPPVLTDAGGRFEVTGLRTGTYRLRAEAHAEGARGFVDGVSPGSDVRIEAVPLAGLAGRVRRGDLPVREYTVTVRGASHRSQQVYAPDGRFVMSRLDPGEYEVTVQCGDGLARAEVELVDGATAEVEVELGGWSTLRGVVVDAGTGDPISGLSISVIGEGGIAASGSVMGALTGAGPQTDDDGRFVVHDAPPGRGTIMFLDRDASDGLVAKADYDVEPGQEHDLGTIVGVAPRDIEPDERGTLGLSITAATYARRPRIPAAPHDEERAVFDQTQRLWISGVAPGGPAALEGLVPGDQILMVEGTRVARVGAATAARLLSPRYVRVDDEITLEIEHAGRRRQVTIMAEPHAP